MAPPKRNDKQQPPPPVIVKKVTVVQGSHHGGAWKVAYADFVTAMMAFFLLLWLLGATDDMKRRGIADYFTPTLVRLTDKSAGSNGLLGGSTLSEPDNYGHKQAQEGKKMLTVPDGGKDKDKEKQLHTMQQKLAEKLAQSSAMRRIANQVRFIDTTEGIRIDLVDNADFSMFRLGTTVLTPVAAQLLSDIAQTLGPVGGNLTIRGHTDALPWRPGEEINNWSLSAGRAEATRQQLMKDGIAETRFLRIEGVADRELLVKENPQDPRNRRISILLTN